MQQLDEVWASVEVVCLTTVHLEKNTEEWYVLHNRPSLRKSQNRGGIKEGDFQEM